MKHFLSIFICSLLLSIPAFAKDKVKKPVKKQTKKIEAKKVQAKKIEVGPKIPEVTEFQVVEDFTKFADYIDEIRYCNVAQGIHIQFLVIAPHRMLFFVCGSLEAQHRTASEYTPNIEDPYTIHWLPAPRKKIHFEEMGGFGGEESEIEVLKDKILVHVSVPWNKKLTPLYTREISCDEKTCTYKKYACNLPPVQPDPKLLPEFEQFLETISDPKNKKSEAWNSLWHIYMGKILFQALAGNDDAQSFITHYPKKESYPSDGFFTETLMTARDDLELTKKAGCLK